MAEREPTRGEASEAESQQFEDIVRGNLRRMSPGGGRPGET
jgi:hypothetical protein